MKIKQFFADVKEEFSWKGFLTVIGAFLFSLSIVGLHNVVKNQFTLPMADFYQVAKSVVAVRDSWSRVSAILVAAFMGTLYKKLGPRGLAWFGGATVAIGYVIQGSTASLTIMYFANFLIGIGTACAGGLMFFTIVKPWWNKAFGTFAALCGTSSGLGGVLFTKNITTIIKEQGYKAGSYRVAILTAIIAFVAGFLMSESPNDALRNAEKAEREARKRGEKVEVKLEKLTKGGKPAAQGAHALTSKDFLKIPATYLIMLMMCMAAFNVATSLFSPVAQANGYEDPNVVGGAALTAYSALLIWTKLGSGALRDAFGMKVVIPVMYIPSIICLAINLFTVPSVKAYPYIWMLMAFSGTATQLLVGFTNVQTFGKYYNVTVHGMVTAVYNVFNIFAAPLRLLPYDLTGSYKITIAIMLVFAIGQWVIAYVCLALGKKVQAKLDAKFAAEDAAKASAEANA